MKIMKFVLKILYVFSLLSLDVTHRLVDIGGGTGRFASLLKNDAGLTQVSDLHDAIKR